MDIRLLGFDGRPAPAGQVGEIAVRAPNVVATYWPDRPALDADGFFHSGDLAQQAADGSFTVVGRAKDMIISGGENIYPAEIEQLLLASPRIADAAVVRKPDAKWGEVPVAFVAARDEELTAEDVIALCRGRIAGYKVPREVRFIRHEDMPRSTTGKIVRSELEALLQ